MTTEKRRERNSAAISPEMKNSEFHRFFVDELKDIYWAEKHLAKSLPKMQRASNSEDLAAQKAEHYEIATYGTLHAFAEQMGHADVAKLLQQTLDNEKATDLALTKIAESFVNEQAMAE